MPESNYVPPVNINAVTIPEKTINDFYQDTLHPAANELGKLIEKPFHFANWVLDSLSDFAVSKMKNTKKLQDEVQEKIDNIPMGQLYEPPKEIVIPALLANSYTDDDMLHVLYANLISSSMDAKYRGHAHPSFVEIIKQLSSEEALLLKSNKLLTNSLAICQVRCQKKSQYFNINGYTLSSKNIIRSMEVGQNIFNYYMPYVQGIPARELEFMIDNFIRLNLIKCYHNQLLTDKTAYEFFYKDMFMEYIETHSNIMDYPEYEIAHIPGCIMPTAFGKRFYEVCIR